MPDLEAPEQSPTAVPLAPPEIEGVKARFAEQYPRIHRIATFQHRRLHGDLLDDAVADTIALAWKNYRRMALEGGDADRLLGSITRYAALDVRAGKSISGLNSHDVMSRRARSEHGYHVTHLPNADDGQVAGEVRDALRHPASGPAEEAACQIDYADWLATLSEKQKEVAEGLKAGLNLSDIAEQRGVSKASVQQVRDTLARKWDERGR